MKTKTTIDDWSREHREKLANNICPQCGDKFTVLLTHVCNPDSQPMCRCVMIPILTTAPIRIQRQRIKGWRIPDNTTYVGRGSGWGNPFHIGSTQGGEPIDAKRAVALYRVSVEKEVPPLHLIRRDLWKLRGKNLACWCPPGSPCHADVLLELANRENIDGTAD